MMKPKINKEKCMGCGGCVNICPKGIIVMGKDNKAKVTEPEKGDRLWGCVQFCPADAIERV